MSTNAASPVSAELDEEAKLRQKYPNLSRKGIGTAALQKRLSSKGHKYFDSGDYNMARAKMPNQQQAPHQATESSDSNSKNDDVTDAGTVDTPAHLLEEVTGDTIATPDNIPVPTGRKRSLTGGQIDLPHQITHPDATVVEQHQQQQAVNRLASKEMD